MGAEAKGLNEVVAMKGNYIGRDAGLAQSPDESHKVFIEFL